MAFTFQINDDVEFNHDKQLLKKQMTTFRNWQNE